MPSFNEVRSLCLPCHKVKVDVIEVDVSEAVCGYNTCPLQANGRATRRINGPIFLCFITDVQLE